MLSHPWDAGAFGGDRHLKSIIQWLAASAAKRDLKCVAPGEEKTAMLSAGQMLFFLAQSRHRAPLMP